MSLGSGLYSGELENIKESTYLRYNKYPNTLTSTYELLVNNSLHMSNDRVHHSQGNSRLGGRGSGRTSVMFVQDTNNGKDDKYCVLFPGAEGTIYNGGC